MRDVLESTVTRYISPYVVYLGSICIFLLFVTHLFACLWTLQTELTLPMYVWRHREELQRGDHDDDNDDDHHHDDDHGDHDSDDCDCDCDCDYDYDYDYDD